jgi:hypothetical protein
VARFSVVDDGIGIDDKHLPFVTQRFYRVDPSRSRSQGGTGLGLAIVKHVLQRHESQLRIESEPGQGSEFSCVFPRPRVRVLTLKRMTRPQRVANSNPAVTFLPHTALRFPDVSMPGVRHQAVIDDRYVCQSR